MLLAENARWDSENRMDETLDDYLALLLDEKPITVRQCIQSLGEIARVKPDLHGKIAARLISLDLTEVRETMRKSVLLDILHVLADIRKAHPTDNWSFSFFKRFPGTFWIRNPRNRSGRFYTRPCKAAYRQAEINAERT